MDKSDYLQFCRYYKGEESNPYEGKDRNKAMLWFYESVWVRDMQKVNQDEKNEKEHTPYMDEYLGYGLADFEKMDDTPITLKSLLFNRYAKGCYSMQYAVEPFKKFYKEYY